MASHGLRALTHVKEAEMSGGGRLRRSEALAVITYGQAHRGGLVPQLDGDPASSPMFHGVGDGFLTDTEQVHLYWAREPHWAALDLEVDPGLFARHQRFDNLLQGRNKISFFEQLAAQIPDRAAGFDHAMTAHVARCFKRVLGHGR